MVQHRRSRANPIVFGALLFLLAACGGTAAPSTTSRTTAAAPTAAGGLPTASAVATPAAGSVDACSLASTSDVSTAFGVTVTATTPQSDPTWSYCVYETASQTTSVTTLYSANAIVLSSLYGSYKNDAASSISGVGDDAFWLTADSPAGVWFRKGQAVAVVSTTSGGDFPKDVQAASTAVAKVMASHM